MSNSRDAAIDLFPLGVASDAAFCNRRAERKALQDNILDGTHTWLMGIRRYGKTSLIQQVSRDLSRRGRPKIHAEIVDLFVVHSIESLDELLRDAVGRLSAQFLPKNRRVMGQLENIFAAFKPELSVGSSGVSLKLFGGQPSVQSIQRLLEALDEAAVKYKRRAVLVIDEFQQISQIDTKHTIEGAIRSVAQHTKALSLVFLGSERTLLAQMFEDRERPLFRLCQKMELSRIAAADYRRFLDDAAKLRWRRTLSDPSSHAILSLSDRHPYYLNVLCRELWRLNRAPGEQKVFSTWHALLSRERHQVYQSMMGLPNAQRAVLAAIAKEPTNAPIAQRYLGKFGIAGSTMAQAIDVLLTKDFIRRSADGIYEVIDPLIKGYLCNAHAPEK